MSEVDTSTLEAIAMLCLNREVFDLAEVEGFRVELDLKGIDHHQVTGPIIDRLRIRTYVPSDMVMNAMLDIRNTIAPPAPKEEPDEAV